MGKCNLQRDEKRVYTFYFVEDDAKFPITCQQIRCHLVFDIKMDSTHKARLVAGGHTTEVVEMSNYSSVVSRESVRIAMVVVALNTLKIEAGDSQSTYLTVPCLEKIYTICGPEFGPDLQGKRTIIVRSIKA